MIVRPLRVQDAAAFRAFVERLSPASRYARFQFVVKELSPQLLRMLVEADPRSHVALAAFQGSELVGEARYVRSDDSAEFAIAVADGWRRRGLARYLLHRLLTRARRDGLRRVEGEVLAGNAAMLAFVQQAGFRVLPHPEDARLILTRLELYTGLRPANASSRSAGVLRRHRGPQPQSSSPSSSPCRSSARHVKFFGSPPLPLPL